MRRFALINWLLLAILGSAHAQQRQGAWWYMATTAVDFNQSPPVSHPVYNGAGEPGPGTISDARGNLLFYCGSAEYVLNRNEQPMPTAVIPTVFASMPTRRGGTAIVPNPGNAAQYYIFNTYIPASGRDSLGQYELVPQLRYGLVDMRLDSGRGDLVLPLATGRPAVRDTVAPKLTVLLHANNRDSWVVSVNYRGDSLLAWPVTPAGIGAVVASAANAPVPLFVEDSTLLLYRIHFIRGSADSELLSCPTDSTVELYRFDRTTGRFAHWFSLPLHVPTGTHCRTAAFSPDGRKLYVGFLQDTVPPMLPALVQYDLTASTPAAVVASRVVLVEHPDLEGVGDIQLAMDGRLYFTSGRRSPIPGDHYFYSNWFSRIDCPNQPGLACRPQLWYDSLSGFAASTPVLNQTLFRNANKLQAQASRAAVCPAGDTVQLVAFGAGADRFAWTGPGGQVLAGGQPRVAPLTTTRYFVTGTAACATDTASVVVRVLPPPTPFDLGPDVTLATGQTATFTVLGNGGQQFQWNTGDTTATLTTAAPGPYWVRVFNAGGCALTDTVRVRALVGLPAANPAAGVRVWPNPTPDGRFTVHLPHPARLLLTDALGRPLGPVVAADSAEMPLDLRAYPAGVYLLRLTWPDGRTTTHRLLR